MNSVQLEVIHKAAAAFRGTKLLLGSLASLIALRLISLGLYPLSDNTESRYAEIARRMASSGDWITPRLSDNVVFWGKPPLSSWLSALSIEIFGVNEWAVRLPSAALALLITGMVWRWTRSRSERWATLSISLLWGSGVFFVAAGAVMTDMALAFAVTVSMYGFWWMLHGSSADRRRNGHLFFAGIGLGMLAKGPVAVVLIGMPVVLWAVWTRNLFRSVRLAPWLSGLSITALICLPWYAIAESRTPGFLAYFFIGEHWYRFTRPGWAGDLYGSAHVQPLGMIWVYLLAGMLPASLLAAGAALVRRYWQQPASASLLMQGEISYLWLFALSPALLFSMAHNVLWTYVLPATPALAVLAGSWLVRTVRPKFIAASVAMCMATTAAIFLAILAWQHAHGGINSAKGVISAYRSENPPQDQLTFVGPLMHSTAFYSAGKANSHKDLASAASSLSNGATQNIACLRGAQLAIHQKVWTQVPQALRQQMQLEGRYGDYFLVTMGDRVAPHPILDLSGSIGTGEKNSSNQRSSLVQDACAFDRAKS